VGEKLVGSECFLSRPIKMFSHQIGKKVEEKTGTRILNKKVFVVFFFCFFFPP